MGREVIRTEGAGNVLDVRVTLGQGIDNVSSVLGRARGDNGVVGDSSTNGRAVLDGRSSKGSEGQSGESEESTLHFE